MIATNQVSTSTVNGAAQPVFRVIVCAVSRESRVSLLIPVFLLLLVVSSSVAQADTSAPSNLTARSTPCGVRLSWQAPTADADTVTGYRLLRGEGSGDLATLVDRTESTATEYLDETVDRDSSYSYMVRALRSDTASADSNLTEIDVPQTPTPTMIPVDAMPMVVTSTTADYFVLYVMHEYKSTELWIPVSVVRGQDGTTTVAEQAPELPLARYRLEQYQVANPADIDHDCIDDLTELDSFGQMSPVNPASSVASSDGAVGIPDWATFESLAHDNQGKSYVSYVQFGINTSRPGLYFLNTSTYPIYGDFMEAIGRSSDPWTRAGTITYDPKLLAPNGSRGAFYFTIGPYADFLSLPARTYTLLAASIPLIDNNLVWRVENYRLPEIQSDLSWIGAARFGLVADVDVRPDLVFLNLNAKQGYGRLQIATPGYRPSPLEIMIYETLPTTLPRVAGIISTTPQTHLSMLNLRARQSGVPNAVIGDALEAPHIASLIGSVVQYEVTEYSWVLRAATSEQADAHYESSRPVYAQTPARDLSVTEITTLSDIGFNGRSAFGVQAANVAVLRAMGFPSGTAPDGFAIPFYFYDEFMKTHNFYDRIKQMLADEEFQSDHHVQANKLHELRDDIEAAASPSFIIAALTAMHANVPQGTMLRYRPSTNNEDLPSFNGAGLYDSTTQNSDATEIDRSFKQVLASLWSYRAFTEREFHRIDHFSAAMGVLVHPSTSNVQANGGAVSFDLISDVADTYYLNVYPAQDQITRLVDHPSPEEWLLRRDGRYQILASSNQVDSGTLLLNDRHLKRLRQHLESIHDHFKQLYLPNHGESFAMEIAFTIASDDILSIEQARPWVFATSATDPKPVIVTRKVIDPPTPPVQRIQETQQTTAGGGGGGPPPEPIPSDKDFDWNVTRDFESLDRENEVPTGIWSDGETLWVLENAASGADTVFAYDLETNERLDDQAFDLDRRNRFSHGIWSDGETVWVADSGQDQLFGYALENGQRMEDREFELAERNRDPRGIWSDGESIYVLDSVKDALFVYNVEMGALVAEHPLNKLNRSPRGIWSDGVTIWVSDDGANRIFAYEFEGSALTRNEDLEFTFRSLLKAGNGNARGIWSDGDVMYVVDEQDDKVYTYNIPDTIIAQLASLTLSDIDIGEFSANRVDYSAILAQEVSTTTVRAEAAQETATVEIEPVDTDSDADSDAEQGYQVSLEAETTIVITVSSEDASRTKVYRVVVIKPPCLEGLTDARLSEVTFVGGSVGELAACARSADVGALYHHRNGVWTVLFFHPEAPAFLNQPFHARFADGLPEGEMLVARR